MTTPKYQQPKNNEPASLPHDMRHYILSYLTFSQLALLRQSISNKDSMTSQLLRADITMVLKNVGNNYLQQLIIINNPTSTLQLSTSCGLTDYCSFQKIKF